MPTPVSDLLRTFEPRGGGFSERSKILHEREESQARRLLAYALLILMPNTSQKIQVTAVMPAMTSGCQSAATARRE